MTKEVLIKMLVDSFNRGSDNGILSVIEMGENTIKLDKDISLNAFIHLVKIFHLEGKWKVTDSQVKEKFGDLDV